MSTAGKLSARNLCLWRGDALLFEHLDLQAQPGRLVHVCGPNGIGKSSLLRVLCGLTHPEEGSVSWGGRDIRHPEAGFHGDLAWLGHRDGLKNDLDAVENLQFLLGLRRTISLAAIREALATVGLERRLDVPVRALSAGQRRRVAIARVLLSAAPLWILDEPFANLDVDGRTWCETQIAAHLANGGTAVLTSHQALAATLEAPDVLELGQ